MIKFLKKLYSIKFIMVLVFFCITLAVSIIGTRTLIQVYVTRVEEQRVSELSAYATRLSNQLNITNYISSPNRSISNQIDVAAELNGGRIIVTNNALQVVYDTYGRALGKTIVLNDVVSALNGSNASSFDWKLNYGYYAYGVPASDGQSVKGAIYFIFSIEDEAETLANYNRYSQIISSLLCLISILLGYIVSTWLLKPLKGIRNSMNKVSTGDLDAQLAEEGVWEFRDISSSTNEMLKKVRATELSQQEFVSDVSHELKTPMASMKVLADSLLMQDIDDVEIYKEFLKDIDEQIDRENEIIQDLLTLVRIDKKAEKLKVKQSDMNHLMEVVLNRVRPLAEKQGIEIVYESYRDITAEVDENKLIMAITNFVENGVKYNKEMGRVTVTLNADASYAYINVEDTGIGIPEESLNHIFDRFYRVDKARSRETGGTGLGLAIAFEVIKMHNGEVRVLSRENVGTTFVIKIPLNFRNTDHIEIRSEEPAADASATPSASAGTTSETAAAEPEIKEENEEVSVTESEPVSAQTDAETAAETEEVSLASAGESTETPAAPRAEDGFVELPMADKQEETEDDEDDIK